ncbi:MAG: phage major capsid protein [Clostridiales bacterium]|nr:phage major capsid protein [Clostridiales bacterium]
MNNTSSVDTLLERLYALNDEAEELDVRDYKSELEAKKYERTFWDVARGLLPKNALKEGSDGSGGFLVPDEFEKKLVQALETANVMRRLGNVITTRFDIKLPTVVSHGSAAWVDEEMAIPDSDDTFGQIVITAHKIASRIIVSDELMEDAGFDLERYITEEFARRIGKKEEEAFLTGDGIGKPLGVIQSALVGAVSGEAGTIGIDDVMDLIYSVGQRYRERAVWLMSGDAHRVLYKVKSARGQNIWQPSLIEGQPDLLLGKPVIVSDAMPTVAAGNKPVLFGDFKYYVIGDRGRKSLKRLDELYAATGQIGFIASQRVDGKLILPEAIKSLQVQS